MSPKENHLPRRRDAVVTGIVQADCIAHYYLYNYCRQMGTERFIAREMIESIDSLLASASSWSPPYSHDAETVVSGLRFWQGMVVTGRCGEHC